MVPLLALASLPAQDYASRMNDPQQNSRDADSMVSAVTARGEEPNRGAVHNNLTQ
jgi:hypothetical protein